MMITIKRWGVRFLFLMLLLVSAQRGFASMLLEKGKWCYDHHQYHRAMECFQKALPFDSGDPELIRWLGFSAYQQSLREPGSDWLGRSVDYFARLTQMIPYGGRARSYLANLKFKQALQSDDGLTEKNWRPIKILYDRAVIEEPESAWVAFQRGRGYLEAFDLLTDQDREVAVRALAKAAALHYPREKSPYLEPAIRLVWKRFRNLEMIKQILPPDELSYLTAVDFMAKMKLWSYREKIYPEFERLTQQAYDEEFRKAIKIFERGDYRRAEIAFEKCSWINKNFVRAPLGVLAARQQLHRFAGLDLAQLRRGLENRTEAYGPLLPALGELVRQVGDPYLSGLYFMQTGDYLQAKDCFEKVKQDTEFKALRRNFVRACVMTDDSVRRDFYLKQILGEEAPDIRDLEALRGRDPQVNRRVNDKIHDIATYEKQAAEWWSSGRQIGNRLTVSGARAGVVLNLIEGTIRMTVALRSIPDSHGVHAYLRLRLFDDTELEHLWEWAIPSASWTDKVETIETTGGYRWLEAELVNAETGRPWAELGRIKIEYLNDRP